MAVASEASSPICFEGPESFDFIRSIHSGRKSKVWVAKIEEDVEGLAGALCVVKMIEATELQSREQVQHVWGERRAAYMVGQVMDTRARASNLKLQTPDLRERCCALLGTYKTNSQVCLVLTAMKGDPIHHHFQHAERGHFADYRAKYYIHYVASTLRLLHREGYVYRDLKASNVLLVEGRPVLIDFGMCKKIAEAGGRTYSVCGTYHAMAPEVRALSGLDHDIRVATTDGYGYAVDFWALGILLVELLTGKPPFGYRNGDIGDLFDLSRGSEGEGLCCGSSSTLILRIGQYLELASSRRVFYGLANESPWLGSPSTIHWASGVQPSQELRQLVESLLQPEPSERLADWEVVLGHPYFNDINDNTPPPEWDHDLGADLWDTDVSDESFMSSSVDAFCDF